MSGAQKKKVIILIIPIISRGSEQRHSTMESDQSQEWKSSVGHDPLALALLTYLPFLFESQTIFIDVIFFLNS